MNSNVKVSRNGAVRDASGERIGWVEQIQYPFSRNGQVWTELFWEARQDHEVLIVNDYAFPTFATRREAVEYLVGCAR